MANEDNPSGEDFDATLARIDEVLGETGAAGAEPDWIALRQDLDQYLRQHESYTAEDITAMKTHLQTFGYYEGEINGEMDAALANAMITFLPESIAFREPAVGAPALEALTVHGDPQRLQVELLQNPFFASNRLYAHSSQDLDLSNQDDLDLARRHQVAMLAAQGLYPASQIGAGNVELEQFAIALFYDGTSTPEGKTEFTAEEAAEHFRRPLAEQTVAQVLAMDSPSYQDWWKLQASLNSMGYLSGRVDADAHEITSAATLAYLESNPELIATMSESIWEPLTEYGEPAQIAAVVDASPDPAALYAQLETSHGFTKPVPGTEGTEPEVLVAGLDGGESPEIVPADLSAGAVDVAEPANENIEAIRLYLQKDQLSYEDVGHLQAALNAEGFEAGNVDRDFRSITAGAVVRYLEANPSELENLAIGSDPMRRLMEYTDSEQIQPLIAAAPDGGRFEEQVNAIRGGGTEVDIANATIQSIIGQNTIPPADAGRLQTALNTIGFDAGVVDRDFQENSAAALVRYFEANPEKLDNLGEGTLRALVEYAEPARLEALVAAAPEGSDFAEDIGILKGYVASKFDADDLTVAQGAPVDAGDNTVTEIVVTADREAHAAFEEKQSLMVLLGHYDGVLDDPNNPDYIAAEQNFTLEGLREEARTKPEVVIAAIGERLAPVDTAAPADEQTDPALGVIIAQHGLNAVGYPVDVNGINDEATQTAYTEAKDAQPTALAAAFGDGEGYDEVAAVAAADAGQDPAALEMADTPAIVPAYRNA